MIETQPVKRNVKYPGGSDSYAAVHQVMWVSLLLKICCMSPLRAQFLHTPIFLQSHDMVLLWKLERGHRNLYVTKEVTACFQNINGVFLLFYWYNLEVTFCTAPPWMRVLVSPPFDAELLLPIWPTNNTQTKSQHKTETKANSKTKLCNSPQKR